MTGCKHFDNCTAPLCPGADGRGHWFPGEDICRLLDCPPWVKRQRKIARRASPEGCYTVTMLSVDCRITKGMRGIDPDGDDRERARDEADWLQAHPAITEEEREKMKAMGEALAKYSFPAKGKKP